MGLFITLEGIEGAGKSTLRVAIAEVVREFGLEAVLTREPGATALGASLRELLLSISDEPISEIAEVMLFAADRAQHVERVIRPALERGAVVICDRYLHSTLAYQGFGRGVRMELLEQVNALAINHTHPDKVFLLDCPPEVGLERVRTRRVQQPGRGEPAGGDRFEAEELAFHRRVRDGFLNLAQENPALFSVLNAQASSESVAAEAQRITRELLVARQK